MHLQIHTKAHAMCGMQKKLVLALPEGSIICNSPHKSIFVLSSHRKPEPCLTFNMRLESIEFIENVHFCKIKYCSDLLC